jgi:RHS repeat-associated protein
MTRDTSMGSRRGRLHLLLVLPLLLGATPARAQETVTYYHTDAVGSVRLVTNASGAVVARYDYRPFGDPCGTACGAQGTTETRQFTGKEKDAENGFAYFGGRYHASQTGRFTMVDPAIDIPSALANPQHWNRYAYVANRPLALTDPDGRCAEVLSCTVEFATLGSPGGPGGTAIGALLGAAIGGTIAYFGAGIYNHYAEDQTAEQPPPHSGSKAATGGDQAGGRPGTYRPDRTLPTDPKTGVPIGEKKADGTPAGAHSQIGKKTSANPGTGDYTKGREFDSSGRRVKDVDFTDHGRPKDHQNPHQHRYTPKRQPAEDVIPE